MELSCVSILILAESDVLYACTPLIHTRRDAFCPCLPLNLTFGDTFCIFESHLQQERWPVCVFRLHSHWEKCLLVRVVLTLTVSEAFSAYSLSPSAREAPCVCSLRTFTERHASCTCFIFTLTLFFYFIFLFIRYLFMMLVSILISWIPLSSDWRQAERKKDCINSYRICGRWV